MNNQKRTFQRRIVLLAVGIIVSGVLIGFLIYQLIGGKKDRSLEYESRNKSENESAYVADNEKELAGKGGTDIDNAGGNYDTGTDAEKTAGDIVSVENALYTYEQMVEDLELLKDRYPGRLSVWEAGRSADGRKIMGGVLGNTDSPNHILIQASIHGREYMNTLLVMKQLEEVLKNYENGSYYGRSYESLFNDVCFHILPMTNPDGVTISQSGPEGIRDSSLREQLENCYQNDLTNGEGIGSREEYWKRWKSNARGVDLNRNFDSGWEEFQGVSYPSADHYKGEMPESEPEVQAILNVADRYPMICTISYHSSGEVIYWDYGSDGEILEADRNLADLVSDITGYSKESSVQSAQDAAGCSDYFVLERGIPSVTIENGSGQCPLSIEEFDFIWNANSQLWPALAEKYGQ